MHHSSQNLTLPPTLKPTHWFFCLFSCQSFKIVNFMQLWTNCWCWRIESIAMYANANTGVLVNHWRIVQCRDSVKVLWCHSYLVWLVFEGSITTCACFHSENFLWLVGVRIRCRMRELLPSLNGRSNLVEEIQFLEILLIQLCGRQLLLLFSNLAEELDIMKRTKHMAKWVCLEDTSKLFIKN